MSYGQFENRVIASAKLGYMEKYGVCNQEDICLVQESLGDELDIMDNGDGTFKVRTFSGEFVVKVRNYQPPRQVATEAVAVKPSEPQEYVSVFDVRA